MRKTQDRILGILRTKHVGVTPTDVAREAEISAGAVRDALRRLERRGLVVGEKRSPLSATREWRAASANATASAPQ